MVVAGAPDTGKSIFKAFGLLSITDCGFRILGKLEGVTGLLGWSALLGQERE